MKEIPVTFESGGEQIVGVLHLPHRGKCPAVVFLHGFTGSKVEAHRLFVIAARLLAESGIAALRFDFRGSGDSAGDFSCMTISREVEDARAAMDFIRARPEVDAARVGLVGMSMGGMVGALLLGEDAGIGEAVLWCPVADFGALVRSNRSYMTDSTYEKDGIADYGGWPVGQSFVEDGFTHRPVSALAKSRANVLVVHGDADLAVPVGESALYTCAARREIISGADHTFNSLAWTKQVVDLTVSWFRQRWL